MVFWLRNVLLVLLCGVKLFGDCLSFIRTMKMLCFNTNWKIPGCPWIFYYNSLIGDYFIYSCRMVQFPVLLLWPSLTLGLIWNTVYQHLTST